MIDLIFFKKKYFDNEIIVTNNQIYDMIRNRIFIEERNEYAKIDSIEILKLISDRVFFFTTNNDSKLLKNLLWKKGLKYMNFEKNSEIEWYLYKIINDSCDRLLVFNLNSNLTFSNNKISYNQKRELLKNLNNDIIYLSNNIILLKSKVFLPWLWKCKNDPFGELKKLEIKFETFYLEDKWNF